MKLDMTNIVPAAKLRRSESLEELERQREEVAALPGGPPPAMGAPPTEGFQRIVRKNLEKSDRHNQLLKAYEAEVVAISEDLERRLVAADSRAASDRIAEADAAIKAALD
eukprot:CAMPEP_0206386030 /NCGR_PEP_ID=MMETSP0294-20121207/15654_1 /ASSEMBLY_ACC=CAM_ASM_000327 /TAXON_ID=39354 /ORGANISM="Heterosigma akashiwo, Strain CCMP2393" /LENGTH=109 /DNA_ID=CAMNT_0053836907 /DNA_START=401 /DNA_END=727 /DNA_ORIENTATION=+